MAVRVRPSAADRPTPGRAGPVVAKAAVPLLAAAVGIAVVMWVLGSLLVSGSVPAFIGSVDARANEWAVEHRTPTLDSVTHVGTMMADTVVALAVAAVAVVALRIWLGRWRESLALVLAVVGELLIFLVITAMVHRARPSVAQLDQAPPTSSFPSGHTGAAVALYGCLAVILLRTVRPRWLGVVLAVLGGAVPVVVAASRVYRGMHYPTDVVAGALAAGVWVAVVLVVVLRNRPTSSLDWAKKNRRPDPRNWERGWRRAG